MKSFVLTVLMFFDFFHKRKVLVALKSLLKEKKNIIFDVGAHQGESISFFEKNFNIFKIYSFEPLKNNFIKLKKNTSFFRDNIVYLNCALGEKKEIKIIKEMIETSSSTLNDINEKSNYYKKKKFLLGLSKKEKMFQEKNVSVDKGINIMKKFGIKEIDLLKIDTEGYEFNVIKGFGKSISTINLIMFEHHYDLMINKNYTYSELNKYLKNAGFKLKYKFKMPFRKTFEYIYSK